MGVGGDVVYGGCEPRGLGKFKKNILGSGGGVGLVGGQGGCERRIEVFVKIPKKIRGGGGSGRVRGGSGWM